MSRSIPPKNRRLVMERCGGSCEGCGVQGLALEIHHRKFRGRGGDHSVPNLVALCGWGNHTGCHGEAHSADPPPGWAVHRWEDPALVPFTPKQGEPVYLTDDGKHVPVGEHVPF